MLVKMKEKKSKYNIHLNCIHFKFEAAFFFFLYVIRPINRHTLSSLNV